MKRPGYVATYIAGVLAVVLAITFMSSAGIPSLHSPCTPLPQRCVRCHAVWLSVVADPVTVVLLTTGSCLDRGKAYFTLAQATLCCSHKEHSKLTKAGERLVFILRFSTQFFVASEGSRLLRCTLQPAFCKQCMYTVPVVLCCHQRYCTHTCAGHSMVASPEMIVSWPLQQAQG